MKRRSLFAGLLAAFAPIVPALPTVARHGKSIEAMIAESRAYAVEINSFSDRMRATAANNTELAKVFRLLCGSGIPRPG